MSSFKLFFMRATVFVLNSFLTVARTSKSRQSSAWCNQSVFKPWHSGEWFPGCNLSHNCLHACAALCSSLIVGGLDTVVWPKYTKASAFVEQQKRRRWVDSPVYIQCLNPNKCVWKHITLRGTCRPCMLELLKCSDRAEVQHNRSAVTASRTLDWQEVTSSL